MSELLEDLQKLLTPVLEQENVELVDLTFQKGPNGWVLCFYIDRPGGITLDDCEKWSRQVEAVLDASDLISQSYSLEVSSPGVYRPLKKVSDYQRFAGERVSVKLYAPFIGQKTFHGILMGTDGENIQLKGEGEKEVLLRLCDVAKTKLDPIIEI